MGRRAAPFGRDLLDRRLGHQPPSSSTGVGGVWVDDQLHLSIGSPTDSRELDNGRLLTIHLDSSNDVVIIEGSVRGPTDDPDLSQLYAAKYDWNYRVAEYGPLTTVVPSKAIAWRTAGWAGRDGFQQSGAWTFPKPHAD